MQLPAGFSFSSVAAGIKASGRPDLALVECSPGTKAAAVFTRNRVIAAPVQVGRTALKLSRGAIGAVVVNSGNANCATGPAGLNACEKVCRETAVLLGVPFEQVFPSSTGIIGVPLPVKKIVSALPALISTPQATEQQACQFARTIMTTDTRPKLAWTSVRSRGRECKVLGIGKGSGMIHPKLATMLVYLFTDAKANPGDLKGTLREICDETFNCISVDGDTSTNDTVLLMASGKSNFDMSGHINASFRNALLHVCASLAQQIVSDGEGVQHVIRLSIERARNRAEAMQIARAVAHSPLVKTAWAGADPNWGRILAACGNSGVTIDPAKVDIFIGGQKVCSKGEAWSFDESKAHAHLSQPVCDLRVRLGRGSASVRFYTTDLTTEYVRINADYST
ncbi:MAG TPA: bifunctional glutamate N-acetyltransferase/amino-acid acetyltransferase ArgJ [Terriglobales bacterium]|nr:bifunctional glutamate N-acetyltransferase/amino-acid acetyltransferase ArgJ [Terriglobales bacterium]